MSGLGLFLVNTFLFTITAVLTTWWACNLLLSLFYALPKSLVLCARGAYSWKLPLRYAATILLWFSVPVALLVGAGYVLGSIASEKTVTFITTNWGIVLGQWVGIGATVLFAIFSKKTRSDMKSDFEAYALKYLRDRSSSESGISQAAHRILKRGSRNPAHYASDERFVLWFASSHVARMVSLRGFSAAAAAVGETQETLRNLLQVSGHDIELLTDGDSMNRLKYAMDADSELFQDIHAKYGGELPPETSNSMPE